MTKIPDNDDQAVALAALVLDHPDPPIGNKPTTAELWDWMHDSLSSDRSAEVQSYVARDPDTFEQWRQLRQSEYDVARFDNDQKADVDGSENILVDWWCGVRDRISGRSNQSIAGIAVGLTMVMVFVTTGLLRQAPDFNHTGFWSDWQSPKQNGTNAVNTEQKDHLQTILSGIALYLREQQQPETGPHGEELPAIDCRISGKCSDESRLLFTLGQRVATARARCLNNLELPDDDVLTGLLADFRSTGNALMVHRPLNAWIEASSDKERCAAVANIISRALNGVAQ